MRKSRFIIGIDEAGRGPLAGPVAVGIVIISADFDASQFKGVRDSKKLSEIQREVWFKKITDLKKKKLLNFHVSLIHSTVIDKEGISFAIKKGIKECLNKIKANAKNSLVLLDGSLKAPEEFLFQRTIIKGDDKISVISAASVMAKVTRDRKMKFLSKKYPKYGLEIHKGYGTLAHRQKIKKHGISPIHRKTFLKAILTAN